MFCDGIQNSDAYTYALKIWQHNKPMNTFQIFDVTMWLLQHTTKPSQCSIHISEEHPSGVVVGVAQIMMSSKHFPYAFVSCLEYLEPDVWSFFFAPSRNVMELVSNTQSGNNQSSTS